MNKPQLYLIYDTSFLMSDHYYDLGYRIKYEDHLGLNEVPVISDYIDIINCVPLQVEKELQVHFDDDVKSPLARTARKRIVSLYERGAERIELPTDTSNAPANSVLSADSPVDKGILLWALNKLRGGQAFCIILTDDGGILYDIVQLKKTNSNLLYWAKENESQIADFIRRILWTINPELVECIYPRAYISIRDGLPTIYSELLTSFRKTESTGQSDFTDLDICKKYGLPFCLLRGQNIFEYKLLWEHIRKTRSRNFIESVVGREDILRKMSWSEARVFKEFCILDGKMDIIRICEA